MNHFTNLFFTETKPDTFERSLANSGQIITILKHVFGELEFDDLYAFLKKASINSRAKIIVFTTRRSHLLFSLFSKYVFTEKEKEELVKRGKLYISDKAVHFYKRKIKGSKVLIVDDIMIHGRALKNVRMRVEKYQPREIETRVYAISDKSHATDVKKEKVLFGEDWKTLSNQIVASLILTSTPYASYIYSFSKSMALSEFNDLKANLDSQFIFNDNIKENIKIDLSLQESDQTENLHELLKDYVQGYIYPMTEDENNSEFLRIYYNNLTNLCVIIPTVFLDEYTSEGLLNACKKAKLNKIVKSEPEVMYRALTAYYSLEIIDKYKKVPNCIDDHSWNVNDKTINMSYYNGFYYDIYRLIAKKNGRLYSLLNSSNHIYLCFSDISKYSVNSKVTPLVKLHNDIYFATFLKSLEKTPEEVYQSCKNNNEFPYNYNIKHSPQTIFLFDYLRNVNQREEDYLNSIDNIDEAEKQVGYSFVLSNLIFEKKYMTPFEFYSRLISGADSGLITFYADKFNLDKETYFSNFLITGEQLCRLYQNKYFILVLLLLKYFTRLERDENITINIDFSKFLDNILNSDISSSAKNNISKVKNYLKSNDHLKMDDFTAFFIENIYEGVNDKELNSILQNGYNYLS